MHDCFDHPVLLVTYWQKIAAYEPGASPLAPSFLLLLLTPARRIDLFHFKKFSASVTVDVNTFDAAIALVLAVAFGVESPVCLVKVCRHGMACSGGWSSWVWQDEHNPGAGCGRRGEVDGGGHDSVGRRD